MYEKLLANPNVLLALKEAWQDSCPGEKGGHEEGGFVVLTLSGDLEVIRWQRGSPNSIILPPHPYCKYGRNEILATFHTHPNTGKDYLQEPGETDKRAVRDDPDLKGKLYEGEFVISYEKIYLISPNGKVNELGETNLILGEV